MARPNNGSNRRGQETLVYTVVPPRQPGVIVRQPVEREAPVAVVAPLESSQPAVPQHAIAPELVAPSPHPAAPSLPEWYGARRERRSIRLRAPRVGTAVLMLASSLAGAGVMYGLPKPAAKTECRAPYEEDNTIKLESCVGLPSKSNPNKLVKGLATFALISNSDNGEHVRYDPSHGYGVGVETEIDPKRFYEVYGKDAKYPDGKPIKPEDLTAKTYIESLCGLSTETHNQIVGELAQLVELAKKHAGRITQDTKYTESQLEVRQNLYTTRPPYSLVPKAELSDTMYVFSNEAVEVSNGAPPPASPISPFKLECKFPGAPDGT